MKRIMFTNDNGNVSAGIRKGIKEGAVKMLVEKLGDLEYEVVENARGGISIEVGEDINTGQSIYVEISVSANMKSPDTKKTTSKKKKDTNPKSNMGNDIFEYKENMKKLRANQ